MNCKKRNQIILQMRKEGYSLQKIGTKFNLSREWIRRILQEEFNVVGKIVFDPKKEAKEDEYTSFEVAALTGYDMSSFYQMIKEKTMPSPSRSFDKIQHQGIHKLFWKKKDIDRWNQIKLKYLKIGLENFINKRLLYPYKFTHHKIQKRYKLLSDIQKGDWKGKVSYNSGRAHEAMKEFNNLKPAAKYIPTDYSKHINRKTKECFAKEGLYNGLETASIIGISHAAIGRYRSNGVLRPEKHYVKGDHYFTRFMYYPEKVKNAIKAAGYEPSPKRT